MKTNISRKLIILCVLSFAIVATAATISRVKTFSDGEILTASDLNAEFDNVVDGVNSITNDNIASNAAISPTKISSAIKGTAIDRNSTSGALSVKVDDATIEVDSDVIRVKDDGITGAKLNSNVVDNVTLEQTGNTLRVKTSGIGSAQIADGSITQAKRASLGIQISASSGLSIVTDSSTSFADVPNLSVTITTTGRPVFIGIMSDGTDQSNSSCQVTSGSTATIYAFERSGTLIAAIGANNGDLNPCSSYYVIDTPTAGTYTYKFRQKLAIASNSTRSVLYAKLVAYEL